MNTFIVAIPIAIAATLQNYPIQAAERPAELVAASKLSKPVVILTYPASISDQAAANIRHDYMSRGARWPSKCAGEIDIDPCEKNENSISDSIAKTLFYLPDAVLAIQQLFPNATVITLPARLDINEAGALQYENSSPELPASVRIDFMARVSTRTARENPSFGNTRGLMVVPTFVVHSSSKKFGAADGLVATHQGLGSPVPNARFGQPSVILHLVGMARTGHRGRATTTEVLDKKTYKLSDEKWAILQNGSGPVADEIFVKSLSPVLKLLSADMQIPREQLEIYAGEYPELTGRHDRLELAAEFANAETDLLLQQTSMQTSSIRNSDFGVSMRKLFLAEQELKKRANAAMWAGALGMLAGGLAGAAAGGSFGIGAIMELPAYHSKLAEIQQSFDKNFAPVAARQYRVSIRIGDQQKAVQAQSVSDLRDQFRALLRTLPK